MSYTEQGSEDEADSGTEFDANDEDDDFLKSYGGGPRIVPAVQSVDDAAPVQKGRTPKSKVPRQHNAPQRPTLEKNKRTGTAAAGASPAPRKKARGTTTAKAPVQTGASGLMAPRACLNNFQQTESAVNDAVLIV